jgi:lipopolysaccharide transport system ATP-binding protein
MDSITVKNLNKKFRIPHQKRTTFFQNIIGLVSRQMVYEEFMVLKDINFYVKPGETLGVIGRNGSGKSTLLKMLARVLYPDSGSIATQGKVASFLELGVGFQPELSAAENVYIYASVLGMTHRETRRLYEEIFEFAELKRFENMKLKSYSSGMTLRLAFSTAIQAKPDIILIDEVLAVGDEAFQKKCIAKINEFKEQGKTIVFVSHSLGAVKSICTRTLLLDKGSIVARGEPEKVINQYLALVNNPI